MEDAYYNKVRKKYRVSKCYLHCSGKTKKHQIWQRTGKDRAGMKTLVLGNGNFNIHVYWLIKTRSGNAGKYHCTLVARHER